MNLAKRFPALESKDYRLWFFGQGISVIGTWLQNTGQSWLVLSITNSSFKLGLLNAVQYLPSLLLSVIIGPFLDIYPKRTILLWTQSLFAVAAAVLAAISFTGTAQYWHVLAIAACTGMLTAIDWPARQSFVSEMVNDRTAVVNAVALNSMLFNIARVIGPSIGGILIAAVGIPWTFAINALSYIAVILGLFLMEAGRTAKAKTVGKLGEDIREGWNFIRKDRAILTLLGVAGFVSLFMLNFSILIPAYSKLSLRLNAEGYGILMSALGAGALGAGLLMAWTGKRLRPKPRLIFISGAILAAGLVFTGIQRNMALASLSLALCGFGMASFTTMCNTSVQMRATEEMRGRVMAAYNLVFVGITPLGSLYTGGISEAWGPQAGFLASGLIGTAFIAFVILVVAPRVFGEKIRG